MEQEVEFIKTNDGVLKAYAYAVISRRYSKEFNGIFEYQNLRDSSVEMSVSYDEADEDTAISFDIYGLTVLGKTINGSCPDADAKLVRFTKKSAEKYFSKNDTFNTLKNFANERKQQMESKTYKVDKSKESMSEKPWGDVDKIDLRDKIMGASNKASLVKDVYMLVEDGWEDAPSEHLKYPVMCFEGDTLVYNRYGLSSALAYAKQENESSVINKIKAIYKKLDLDDDSDRKEEEDMAEVEFSAVNISDLWCRLYSAMRDVRHWDYSISGIYEEDNKKFAVIYDDSNKLYRLDFSLTEEGITLADEIIEVKEEFVETENIKKFAEPEDVAQYRKEVKAEEQPEEEKEEDEDSDDADEEEKEEEMAEATVSIDELQSRISQLEKDIEERDNIIMDKDKEIAALKEFKEEIEKKEKAMDVESVMQEASEYLDEETLKALRAEGMLCDMCEMDGFKNKVKAMCFSVVKKEPKKKSTGVWGFSAPVESQKDKKSSSVWDRI